jgi:hypothetical protein
MAGQIGRYEVWESKGEFSQVPPEPPVKVERTWGRTNDLDRACGVAGWLCNRTGKTGWVVDVEDGSKIIWKRGDKLTNKARALAEAHGCAGVSDSPLSR